MLAHSDKLVLPTITAPAPRSRATKGASRLVTLSTKARLPAVVGSGPTLSILSLISIGMPNRAPRALDRSSARAWSIAVGSVAMTALIRGLSARIRAKAAAVFDWAVGAAQATPAMPGDARAAARRR